MKSKRINMNIGLSVNGGKKFLEKVDEAWEFFGYTSRTDCVHKLLHELIDKMERLKQYTTLAQKVEMRMEEVLIK